MIHLTCHVCGSEMYSLTAWRRLSVRAGCGLRRAGSARVTTVTSRALISVLVCIHPLPGAAFDVAAQGVC